MIKYRPGGDSSDCGLFIKYYCYSLFSGPVPLIGTLICLCFIPILLLILITDNCCCLILNKIKNQDFRAGYN